MEHHPLIRWAKAQGYTRQALADLLGLSRGALWKLTAGRSQPSLPTALKIQEMTAGFVPPSTWVRAENGQEIDESESRAKLIRVETVKEPNDD